ncbi:hypothetical protein DDZ14_11150 [Maritimibacter sp. 55A14]|uniref:SRPBCC family protein n=1 Tax=Maritimibacter sp. 55A14 TaxID=2174844 RepID=UPI000D60A2B8|nr:SRPBCC family protein [Maritimibacter sp. 55A14]PWE32279.1 hypothetical protein DDZ14_11150 [Maritimibacter sp. 55A14]
MRFTTHEDVEAPIEFVFGQVSDFETFERFGLRNGAEITRLDTLAEQGVGMVWDARVSIRGKQRRINAELVDYESPTAMRFLAVSDGFTAVFIVDLVGLSRKRTRIGIDLDIKPKSISARLMLQSARLAKSSLSKRFKRRVAKFGREIETRFRRAEGLI